MQVGTIATEHQEQIYELVRDLLPIACDYLQENNMQQFPAGARNEAMQRACAVTESLVNYSMNISQAIPSASMAYSEFPWRNGFFLEQCPTPLHLEWLLRANCPAELMGEYK